jgi:NACalpha-BTF3-like transcription factor
MAEAHLDRDTAVTSLDDAEGDLSAALVMSKTKRGLAEAKGALIETKGVIEQAVMELNKAN